MSEPATRSKWSDGISLEGIPYADQPKVIVAVKCYQKHPAFPKHSVALPVVHCDITDWLQANPHEQIQVLDQVLDLLNGSEDLDDLGDPDELDDDTSGDHLVGLDGTGMPAGDDGTDIHILSAYVRYLKECRDRDFIPFSDISGHEERSRQSRHIALDHAHEDILSAVGRYTVLAQDYAAAAEQGEDQPEQRKTLWDKTRALVAHIRPKKKADAS